MLIGLAGTGLPSSVTVPLTEPTVEVSTTFFAFDSDTGFSFVSLLLPPHPTMATAKTAANARFKNLVFIWNNSSLVKRGYSNNSVALYGANSFGIGQPELTVTSLPVRLSHSPELATFQPTQSVPAALV